jgi:hypothetical protein
MMPAAISIGRPRLATALAAVARFLSLNASRFARAAVRSSAFDRSVGKADLRKIRRRQQKRKVRSRDGR